MDNDGDLDLLVGAETGSSVKYFTNDGNNNFEENTTMFSGVDFPDYGRPVLADVDNDNDFDLVIGDGWGKVYFYRNDGNETSPVWVRNDNLFEGIESKQHTHPGFADLDGDTRKDMIIGEYDGNFTFYKNLFSPTSVEEKNTTTFPHDFYLSQNYPNPFNPSTTISFAIPSSSFDFAQDDIHVSLKVYDILGREVATLVNENNPSGVYNVQCIMNNASSGIYFYTLKAGSFSETKKMLLLR